MVESVISGASVMASPLFNILELTDLADQRFCCILLAVICLFVFNTCMLIKRLALLLLLSCLSILGCGTSTCVMHSRLLHSFWAS